MVDPTPTPLPTLNPRKPGRPRKHPPPAEGSGAGPHSGPPDFDPLGSLNAVANAASLPAAIPGDLASYADIEAARIDTTSADFSLTVTDDDDLLDQDLVTHRRLNYVISILRLQHFLRRSPATFAEEFAQAKLAQKVVIDTESSELELHRFGRQAGDNRLADQIANLRSQLANLADKRAKARIVNAAPQENSPSD